MENNNKNISCAVRAPASQLNGGGAKLEPNQYINVCLIILWQINGKGPMSKIPSPLNSICYKTNQRMGITIARETAGMWPTNTPSSVQVVTGPMTTKWSAGFHLNLDEMRILWSKNFHKMGVGWQGVKAQDMRIKLEAQGISCNRSDYPEPVKREPVIASRDHPDDEVEEQTPSETSIDDEEANPDWHEDCEEEEPKVIDEEISPLEKDKKRRKTAAPKAEPDQPNLGDIDAYWTVDQPRGDEFQLRREITRGAMRTSGDNKSKKSVVLPSDLTHSTEHLHSESESASSHGDRISLCSEDDIGSEADGEHDAKQARAKKKAKAQGCVKRLVAKKQVTSSATSSTPRGQHADTRNSKSSSVGSYWIPA